jgi:outer membrane protein assembly factor BamB
MRVCLIAVVLAISVVSRIAWGADFPGPTEQWVYDAGEPITGETEWFPNALQPTHVLVSTLDGELHLVDGAGQLIWKHHLGEPIRSRPAVGDLDGDGRPDIVVGMEEGRVVALTVDDGAKPQWSFQMNGRIDVWRMPALADFDEDGKLETIITDDAGWVVCLSPTGERMWRFTIDKYRASAVGIGDIDGDAVPEIVYGTENDRTVCLTGDGRLRWIHNYPARFGRGAPSLGDLDGDGYPDVVTSHTFSTHVGKIIALDGPTGRLKWTHPLQMWAYTAKTIVDLDGDKTFEVVTVDRSNSIYCVNHDGSERWKITRDGRAIFHAPAVADLDGDGHVETIYAPRGNVGWGVIGDQGQLLYTHRDFESNASPLVGDVNADKKLDLLIANPGNGKVFSYTFGGKTDNSRVLWPTKRRDTAHTGYTPSKPLAREHRTAGRGPEELFFTAIRGAPRWGTNEMFVNWPKDLPAKVLVEVSIGSEDGWMTTRVDAYDRDALPQPMLIVVDQPGRNDVRVTIWDETESKGLAISALTLMLDGFFTFESHVEKHLDAMGDAASQVATASSTVAAGLAARRAARGGQLALAKNRVSAFGKMAIHERDALVADLDTLAAKVTRDAQIASVLKAVTQDELGPILLWADPNPWDESDPIDEMTGASASATCATVNAYLYRNEVESRVVNLLNVTSETISVQCRQPKGQIGIELSEIVSVPRRNGSMVDDALPLLNESHTITLPPGEPRRLWIRCNAGAGEAGQRSAEIEILPLVVNAKSAKITVTLGVADIDLAAAPEFLFCNWTNPGTLKSQGHELQDIQRAVREGLTLIAMGAPAGRLDAKGHVAQPPDWASFDAQLDVLEKRCFLLLHWGVSAPKDLSPDSAAYIKGLGQVMRAMANHLEEKGWPLDRWALYPVDEPGLFQGENMRRFVEVATRFKKAAPEIQVYSNPAGGVTVENFAEIKELCDVWSPELGLLIRQPELVPFFKRGGERVFCYEAPGDAKSLRPLGYYRGHSWLAFQLGLEGGGYWVYTSDDMWKSHTPTEYGANYGTAGVLVHSRRWEATRDGIEDVRAFRLLDELLIEAEASGRLPDLVKTGRALLDQRIPKVVRKSYIADDITRNLFNYDPEYEEILAIRKAVGDLTLQLLNTK